MDRCHHRFYCISPYADPAVNVSEGIVLSVSYISTLCFILDGDIRFVFALFFPADRRCLLGAAPLSGHVSSL